MNEAGREDRRKEGQAGARDEGPPCELCGSPVVVNRERYDVFERMHWLCFHMVYEHVGADPDEPCEDPSCPWRRLEILDGELRRLGVDPDDLPRMDSG